MPDNSGGFVILFALFCKAMESYKGDWSPLFFCNDCNLEFHLNKKNEKNPFCFMCGSTSVKKVKDLAP